MDSMPRTGDIAKETGDIFDTQAKHVLEYVALHGFCSNAQVCSLLGVKSSRSREILSRMKERGLLVSEGQKKGVIYRLPE